MNPKIRLIALDLDGTLFNHEKRITEGNKTAIRKALTVGAESVISSGRPYVGLPIEEMKSMGIRYAITANGAAVYRVPERELLYENCMDYTIVVELMKQFREKEVYCDVFIDGDVYACEDKKYLIDGLAMTAPMKNYIKTTRIFQEDFIGFLKEAKHKVQKITIDFCENEDGSLKCYSEIAAMMKAYPNLAVVSGGSNNLEVTRLDCTKGRGLQKLAEYLNIPMTATMACGDSGNDADILQIAGIGVAMANSEPQVLEIADYVTKSNEEDGVAYAIEKYVL